MKNNFYCILAILLFASGWCLGQNPVIHNQYSADPTARVFGDEVYLFPSHDIQAPEGKNLRKDWFCMADYHVFSSRDLVNWTDHGVIVSQEQVKWVDSTSYSMWAPDCVCYRGKYFFYFPANTRTVDANGRKGFGIGLAVSDRPEGPYHPMDSPIKGVQGIDPNVFIDRDGQAYLIWALGQFYIAPLCANMYELAAEPRQIEQLPAKGLKEGPFMFERNGRYYLTYPHVENNTERLEYAMSDKPTGPFTVKGVIMDEASNGCWTNHQSVVQHHGQWYLFYHQNDWSPRFDKNRSVRIDSLFFNADGTIRKVIPSLRGVGVSPATDTIQIDRYSCLLQGATIAFNDTTNYFAGWKTIFVHKGDAVQYNSVFFGLSKFRSVEICYQSNDSADVKLILQNKATRLQKELSLPPTLRKTIISRPINRIPAGTYDMIVGNLKNAHLEIDWIRFR